jgi:hypothetical protein
MRSTKFNPGTKVNILDFLRAPSSSTFGVSSSSGKMVAANSSYLTPPSPLTSRSEKRWRTCMQHRSMYAAAHGRGKRVWL